MILSTIFPLALLVNTIAASQIPQSVSRRSVEDILTSVFGPLSNWNATRLIDVDPQAIIEGQPATSDVILSWQPPQSASAAQYKELEALLKENDALQAGGVPEKRALSKCYRSGSYVLQENLRRGAFWTAGFCYSIPDGRSRLWPVYRAGYIGSDGSWHYFRDVVKNKQISVLYTLDATEGHEFAFADCVATFEELIRGCHGGNPDSQGGVAVNWDRTTTVRCDPNDLS